jgi:D-amino-acid dehydrogenase
MTDTYDVVVIGGGILGAAVGYHLSRAGLATMVVNRGDPGGATLAGAGIVCPVTATVDDERLVELAFAAAAYYPGLAAELADCGRPTGYARSAMLSVSLGGAGGVQVARTAEWADRVAAEAAGFADMCGHTSLSESECSKQCPILGAEIDAGLLLDAAQVDGHAFRQSLLAAGSRLGMTVVDGDVQRILFAGDDAAGVVVDGTTISAGHVVVCAGAWTDALMAPEGMTPVITPARGEILHLQIDGLDTGSWPLIQIERSGPYIIGWERGRLAVGTTVEPAPDFDARATLAGVMKIADSLERATRGRIEGAKLLDCRVGLRPMSADGLPLIGPWPGAGRVLVATGHGANGLSWGPYTGKLVADMITAQPAAIDLRPFSADRFDGVGWKEQM